MTKKHSTKRALIASILVLCLCLTSFIGTTFAWFTDSVTSANNIIKSGTLDVEMYYADGTLAVPAEDSTDWKDASKGAIFNYKNWEPGYAVARHIKIANEGTLALKYAIRIIPDGEVSELANVIDVYYVDSAVQVSDRAALTDDKKLGTLAEVLAGMDTTANGNLAAGEFHAITLVLKMQESAGNEYQGISIGSTFSVQLVATQLMAEEDSFGKDYDEGADMPYASVPVVLPTEDVTEPVKLNAEGMKVEVPAAVINALPAEVTSIAVEFYSPVVDEESNTITFSSVELVDQNGNKIDLEGNTAPIAVTLPAQTGMEGKNVAVFHDGVFVAAAVADANGFISYETTHFCEVTIVEGVAVTDASELAAAVANGGKILLINDITIANQLEITSDTAINGMGNTLTYTGASRVINSDNAGIEQDPDLTISDLSIYCSASYCQRGINYNDSGKLTLNNVTVTGKNVNYAINLPSSSDGATVTINDSDIIGNIALNVWGENTVTVANNTNFRSYYVSEEEACAVIQYNDDTISSAKGSKLTVNGGSVISDANTDAILVLAKNVTVEVSPETEVVGSLDDVIVATVFYAGYSDFHACGSIERALELAANNPNATIKLMKNLELTETLVIDGDIVIDLNGYAISMEESILSTAYAINNLGTLTLKDSVGTGSVNARGIYNGYGNGGENVPSAKLIVESGTYNAKGTNGGAAIFNYGIVELNGGSFTSIGGYSLNNQSGSTMTVEDGVVVNNGIYSTGATLVVNGGNISGNRSGCHVIYAWNANVTINGGEFYNYNSGNATIMAAGQSVCTINGGTFGIKDGRVPGNGNTWTSCLTDTANSATMIVNGGTFNGGFRVQAGTTMTIVDGSFNDCYGSNYNIYGTVTIKGGDFTDDTAKNFAGKYVSEGYVVLNNGDGTYSVYANTSDAKLTLKDGAVLDLGGVEFKGTIVAEGDLTIKGDTKIKKLSATNGGTITIEDGKTLTLNDFSFGSKNTAGSEYVITGGTIVASYGFFQHGTYALYSDFETGYMYYSYGSDITVYGTFHSQGKGDGLDYVRGKLTVAAGGKSIHDKSLWVGQPASWGAMNATLIVEEGGYVQANSLSVYEGSAAYNAAANVGVDGVGIKYNSLSGEIATK